MCPVAPQLAADTSLNVVEVPLTEAEQLRVDAGIEFERSIFQAILDCHLDTTVVVRVEGRKSAQTETSAAMASAATIVLGGWLPDDPKARRTGRPDVLLRVEGGWIPVDVKHHGMVIPSPLGSELRSDLDGLWPNEAIALPGVEPSSHAIKDALQLAHYWRLLEACGQAADTPLGGIIGSDGGVWWFDLGEPRWKRQSTSALNLYDREFSLRLNVIARQLRRNADPGISPLVIPIRKGECPSCKWRQVCGHELAKSDSVSLLPGVPWPNALRLIRHGVASRAELARLDRATALLMHGGAPGATVVDVAEVLGTVKGLDSSVGLSDALGRRKRTRLTRLAELGMTTVADLRRLDKSTAAISGLTVGYLPDLIDQARVAVSGRVFRARGVERIEVPRADVEVDVDMENGAAGVYLWGTWAAASGQEAGYEPFVDWHLLDDHLEAEVFSRFWDWLKQLRSTTIGHGGTFAAYCYSSAENTQMRRIAASAVGGPSLDEVDSFIASCEWVDLYSVVRGQLLTATGLGLKEVAPLAGFHWRDHDPGGDQSMVWYQRAVGHPSHEVRQENRERLLAYNEDDVRATAAIRDWMKRADFEGIEEWTT